MHIQPTKRIVQSDNARIKLWQFQYSGINIHKTCRDKVLGLVALIKDEAAVEVGAPTPVNELLQPRLPDVP